jgi:thiamine pyrophosphate-dependent acetolactate synthase large subunit-like protein
MLGKQAITEFFLKNNIHYIFQLPGLHTLPLNGLLSQQINISIITGRHESSLVFMADGYARTSGKPGVLIVTAGPGLGNSVSGCMEAFNSDVPLLVIHVDVERKDIVKGILHGVAEPETIFKHITKKTYFVSDIRDLTFFLDDAYRECLSGRKGPVIISIPYTFFEKEVPTGLSSQNKKPEETWIMEADNEQKRLDLFFNGFKELMHGKMKPLIIGGKALMKKEMGLILDKICRKTSIPFLTTTGGKGILREDSSYAFGNIMKKGITKDIITSSDIVIAIGTRLRDVDAKRRGMKIKELVHVDIDEQWIDKNYPSQLKFAGDLFKALHGIQQILEKKTFGWDIEDLAISREKEESLLLKQSFLFAFTKLIRKGIPENTTIVCDLNIPSYWSEYYLPVYHQNSFLMPRGISPIFYSLPASIGAKLGRPDRPCIALCGDGGVLPTIGELSTIQQYNIPVVIFIHNNRSFAILEDVMIDRYGIHGSMNLENPDFVKIARAFGIKAKRTKTLRGLEKIFLNDITWKEPFLIEFVHPVSPPPWKV